uniref:Rab3 n=1 Tax=Suberites domuncula TaxID=55567 RepID=A1XKR7_SUBDO|nr:Rab3 [Suberites domuncula]
MASDLQQRDIESLDTAVDPNFDYMYKVLIVGNSGVGKTAFLVRYCDDTFSPSFVATVGIDFKVKSLFRQDKRIKLQIWDTAGQERYRTITTAYYRGAMGFILMFDLTNEESFLAVKGWSSTIKDMSWENSQMVLVGNKSDLTESRVISKEQGLDLAQSLGVDYYETSAKDDLNVKQTFETLVDLISEKMAESIEKNPNFVPRGSRPRQAETKEVAASGCGC